jgi:hypothetical protein
MHLPHREIDEERHPGATGLDYDDLSQLSTDARRLLWRITRSTASMDDANF